MRRCECGDEVREREQKEEGVDDLVQYENRKQGRYSHDDGVPICHNSYRPCGIRAKGVAKGEVVEWGEGLRDEVWKDEE